MRTKDLLTNPLVLTGLILVGYVFMTSLGQVFVLGDSGVSPYWPAAGFAMGVVILFRKTALPGIFAGALLAALESYTRTGTVTTNTVIISSLVVATSVTAQAWFGYLFVSCFLNTQEISASIKDFLRFCLFTPLVATISSTSGLVLLNLFSDYQWSEFPGLWLIWWGADVAGLCIITPFMVLIPNQHKLLVRGRFLLMIFLMSMVTITVTAVTMTLLYQNYMVSQENRLQQLAQSQATLLNAVAEFDSQYSQDDNPLGWQAATLSQVENAYRNLPTFGYSGEFILGRLREGSFDAMITSFAEHPESVLLNDLGGLDEVLTLAIDGNTGITRVTDQNGERVLAAYAPVSNLDMAVIMKTNLRELNAPFIRTSLASISVAIILILTSTVLFRRISEPLMINLEQRYDEQEKLVEERTTEINKARSVMADQLAFQQVLMDTIPNPIFYTDTRARMIGVNRAFLEISGLEAEEVLGMSILDRDDLNEKDKLVMFREDLDIINNSGFVKRELPLKFADGEFHDTIYSKAGYKKQDGSPGGLVGTFVDISSQKETARQLEIARDEAEKATELKASFLASMSHEIRTPMNGIIGMVELLLHSETNADHRQMLRTIARSSDNLLAIINDILDFSKIEAGKMELDLTSLSIVDAIEGVAEALSPVAFNKDLFLATFVDEKLGGKFTGDPVRVRQIITNLVSNAIKFSSSGTVYIKATYAGTRGDKILASFNVIDQGIGISKENQSALFKAFSQAEKSTTRNFGGTGLGLAISKQLCTLMEGTIGLESEPGVGSDFFFTIPLARTGEEVTPDTSFTGLNVGLITHNNIEAEICIRYLKEYNAEVHMINPDSSREQLVSEINSHAIKVLVAGTDNQLNNHQQLFDDIKQDSTCNEVITVQLSPGQYHEKVSRIDSRQLNIDTSPMKKETFISAIAIAAGIKSPVITDPADVPEEIQTRRAPSIQEARENGTLILVAEDNAINQDVIRKQLHKIGFACVITGDGKQAFEAWQNDSFAVLLTDCHMPEADGFELTRMIRQSETKTGQHLPIIAITANAMEGEAERCLKSGMDDFLSKPLKISSLKKTLAKWCKTESGEAESGLKESDAPAEQPAVTDPKEAVDINVLMEFFDDDQEEVEDILQKFVPSSAGILKEIEAGIQKHSLSEAASAAHKLKSSAWGVGATKLGDLCHAMESAETLDQIAEENGYYQQAQTELENVDHFITRYLEKTSNNR